MKNIDMTSGSISQKLVLFSLPLMAANLLQQLYNLVDTWVVGKYVGSIALAAVGSSYTLMTFLTSILIGLCMGCSSFFAIQVGKKDWQKFEQGVFISSIGIGLCTLVMYFLVSFGQTTILHFLQVPKNVEGAMATYVQIIFIGLFATSIYNYFANILRALGNSLLPLFGLAISVVLNIFLDILFVVPFQWGVAGAAWATVLSQFVSAAFMLLVVWLKFPIFRVKQENRIWSKDILSSILHLSFMTSLQQSIMNFGILLIQGLVNSFGSIVMAAFAVALKIDTLAYMPVQDFGNGFSLFVSQNYGAKQEKRIQDGLKVAITWIVLFCVVISVGVNIFSDSLMGLFLSDQSQAIIQVGSQYLHIEATCYIGIGILFLCYGYYRAIVKPGMSVILTILSLGTRVLLAYACSPFFGVTAIWTAIPIGWFLADFVGIRYYFKNKSLQASKPI